LFFWPKPGSQWKPQSASDYRIECEKIIASGENSHFSGRNRPLKEENILQPESCVLPFSLTDTNGNLWHSGSTAGKILILNFWSAECPWSQKVDVLLKPHLKEWGDRVVYAAIAANVNEPVELIRAVARVRLLPMVLLDEEQTLANQLGAITTPHFFVYDSEGVLHFQGGFDDTNFRTQIATQQYLVEAVYALLEGRKPEVKEAPSFGCTIVRFAS
jgi:hypothetical protein